MRAGLIVNPTAGMGGSVALKGTDGVVDEARRRGALPTAPQRAARALSVLHATAPDLALVTCAGEMGEVEARAAGFAIERVLPVAASSSADDTRAAAATMLRLGVELVLFVGGDGTATDIEAALGRGVPVVGVPAGVKMHSGVFATSPESAGLLAGRFASDRSTRTVAREVMDVDEELLRSGVLAPRLLGYLDVPDTGALRQHPKRRGASDEQALRSVGQAVLEELPLGALAAIGPGSTAGAVMRALDLPHTLLGFDLIRDGALVAADVRAADLVEHADELFVVIAPIGGQGSLLGRGNQQLTPAVLARLRRERLLIVATRERLAGLGGRPLLLDLDDAALATQLAGVRPVLVGPRRVVHYPVAAPSAGLDAESHRERNVSHADAER